MPNYYRDNSDLLFHMKTMDFSRVVELKEDDFKDRGVYPDAPKDVEDARDNYHRVLDIVGDIAGDFVAPRAAEVDRNGAKHRNGEVIFPKPILDSLDRLRKADLMGMTLPRKYDGINMPMTVYMAAIEMISRADASLMLLFGLQGIAETISRFGTDDQKQRYLPRFSAGEVMGAMALTEPDAGSDLQAVSLQADQRPDGKWVLNGVKRFITNGCAEISLVMARSEKEIPGGRGLSLFIYEREGNMTIRRIESKLGLNGSPTCELQFSNAEAELLGKRKFGLIKYTMALLNGARIGVAAQALGIAEAAYREADAYAKDRIQFEKPVREFTAVYEMLTDMKVTIEAARSLLYETTRIVDISDGLEEKAKRDPKSAKELRSDAKRFGKFTSLFTPIVKAYATEMANKVCYDAIQIHGGVGFCTEFNVERHYRDVRVTNIYEGTTQLQVVGAVGGVLGGVVFDRLDEYEENHDLVTGGKVYDDVRSLRASLEAAVSHIKEKGDATFQEYHARRLVEMAGDTIISYLLSLDGLKSERKKKTALLYISKAKVRVHATRDYILSDDTCLLDFHQDILDREEEGVSLSF